MKRPATTSRAARRSPGRLSADELLLERAAELVARGWCRRALAEDGSGREVAPWSENACRWSPLGALIRVWHEDEGGACRLDSFDAAYEALALATGGRVEEWNAAPWRTQWHVLSAFDRACDYLRRP